jgi:hypothetical protein
VVVGECIARLLAGEAGGAEILLEDVAHQRPRQDGRSSFDFFQVGDVDRTPRTLEPRVREERIHEEPDGRHLTAHGGDAERNLAATDGLGAIRDELKQLADPVLDATLDRIPAVADAAQHDPEATLTYSEGSPAAGSRFSILRPHAQGGLGQISVALDSELNREVALKELRPECADDPHSRAWFLLEAEITGRLEHPGIAPVYGLGCNAQGRPFYAMRLVKGQSLKEVNRASSSNPSSRQKAKATSLCPCVSTYCRSTDISVQCRITPSIMAASGRRTAGRQAGGLGLHWWRRSVRWNSRQPGSVRAQVGCDPEGST